MQKPNTENLNIYEKLGVTPNNILGYNTETPIKPELLKVLSELDDEQQDKVLTMIKIML